MKLSLGFSPCPNDCFIFDALVQKKIDTEGLDFDVRLEDVETLNQMALNGELDITKLSFHAYAHVADKYLLLRSGSALGFNCGPLLVTRPGNAKPHSEMKVAIPGKLTTANFLLSIAYPKMVKKVSMVFSEIEEAVLSGKVDAGLLIHENRFTYEQKGLVKIRDLGEFWEEMIHAPIPLGGIAAKRNFDMALLQKINRVIRASVEQAFKDPEGTMAYVKAHAQEMDEEVMKKHIALYVNSFSVDLGEQGEKAVRLMFGKAEELGLFSFGKRKILLEAQ